MSPHGNTPKLSVEGAGKTPIFVLPGRVLITYFPSCYNWSHKNTKDHKKLL